MGIIGGVLRYGGMSTGLMVGAGVAGGAALATDALAGDSRIAGADPAKVVLATAGGAVLLAGTGAALLRSSRANNMAFLSGMDNIAGGKLSVNHMPRPRSEVLGFDKSFDALPQEVALAQRMKRLSDIDNAAIAKSRGKDRDAWLAESDAAFELARGLGISGALAAAVGGTSLLADVSS